jgi:putative DNA primase/helicase
MNLGAGENGKSKFLEYLELLIGKENSYHSTLQQLGADKFQSAELKNKLINTFPDLEDEELRGTGLIKTIITSESITAQKKYGHPFTFKPFCKLLFSCNRFPKVRDQSQGFFRRWIIINWKRNFANDPERNEHLSEKLSANKEERNLVFSSLIHLSNKILESGLTHKPDWKTIQKDWNENADPVSFFVDNFTTDSDSNVPKRLMYSKYKTVCYEKGEKPLGIGQFSKEFEQYYESERTNASRVWLNVKIKESIQTELLENMQ